MTTPERQKFEDGRRLDQWLGEVYRVDVLGTGGSREDVVRRARSVVLGDPALLTIAKERIPELEKVCRVRSNAHVEKKQLEYLRELVKEPA